MMHVEAERGDVSSETLRVLVIGGGVAGCAAGILLSRGGVAVDLVEQQASVTALGSGITLQGNALRVLREFARARRSSGAGISVRDGRATHAGG